MSDFWKKRAERAEAALLEFVKAENDWQKTKRGMPDGTFDDPLSDAYRLAMDTLAKAVAHPPSREYVPHQSVIDAMRAAREALANCYDVQSYPGDGMTVQDGAIKQLDAALSSCERSEG